MTRIKPKGLYDSDLNHAITGWPLRGDCPHCGGEAVLLLSMVDFGQYECRGTPERRQPNSAYSDDRCGRVFRVKR